MATITLNPRGQVLTRMNQCTNPSFELGTASWSPHESVLDAPSGTGKSGLRSLRLRSSKAGNCGAYYSMPVQAGSPYVASAWVFRDGGEPNATFRWFFGGPGGSGDGPAPVNIPPNVFTRITGTFVAPATGTAMFYIVADTTNAAGVGYFADEVIIENSSVLTPFFSGDTPAAGEYSYAWAGPANAAPSQEWRVDPVTLVKPELVLGYETSRESRNVLHHVLGRSDPVPTLRPAALRTGTLELLFLDEATAWAAQEAHSRVGKLAYSEGELAHSSMWYVVPDGASVTRTLDPETRKRWIVSVPYQEVTP